MLDTKSLIIDRTENKLSLTKLARKYKISTYGVREILVEANLISKEVRPSKGRGRKYSVNDYFFENIESEESAYILGFMFADGWLNDRYKQMTITLKLDDIDLLSKISKVMDSSFPIKEHSARYSKEYRETKKCTIAVTSHIIYDDLCKYGCTPRKSDTIKFPTIDEKLIHHFMRGYFDGDGTVFIGKDGTIRFGIISTKEFCDKYISILPYDGKAKVTKESRSNKNVYYFTIGGRNVVKRIYDFLYKDSTIFLDRKKKIFDDYFNKKDQL